MQVAKFYLNETVEDLAPVGGTAAAMPFQYVNMYPGVYSLGGEVWDCTRPGLYRFKVEGQAYFRNRIVQGNAPFDVFAIISGLCWNHIHGGGDESVGNLQDVANRGRYFVWRMRCGFICNFVQWLLPQYGYDVRQVGVITNESRNGYDDGHAVIELLHGGKWKMFDLTNGRYWVDANGVQMSTAEFIAAIKDGAPMPAHVELDGKQKRWDHEAVPGGTLDMGLYGDLLIGSDAQMEAWYRRIYQKVG